MVKILKEVLLGKKQNRIPIWFMRQAGRYLPEYLDYKSSYKTFLEMCLSPQAVYDITCMPLERFDIDAAILFSDILVIPHALGQDVFFENGISLGDFSLKNLRRENFLHILSPIFEGIQKISSNLEKEKTFIGFCGSPWTIATYMIEKGPSKDFLKTFRMGLLQTQEFKELLYLLAESCAEFLLKQVSAGVDVVQIFDTWSGSVPDVLYEEWVLNPVRYLIEIVRKKEAALPILYFPKNSFTHYGKILKTLAINGISCDSTVPCHAMANLQRKCLTQGNLDPRILLYGGEILAKSLHSIKKISRENHIFNLGHGILPETPIAHVQETIALMRD